MAISDPQTVTVSGTAISLPRTFTGTTVGRFASADGRSEMTVTPSNGKTIRRSVRFAQKKITTDPLVTTTNVVKGSTIVVNFSRDSDGYTDAEVLAQFKGLITQLTAASDTLLLKILAGEN